MSQSVEFLPPLGGTDAIDPRSKPIILDRVTKVYEQRGRRAVEAAVRNVSLSVDAGEFLVLVGPSGCGKTTLLRMIAGLEVVTDGTIRIGGQDITDLHPRDRDIAMVFQNYALYPHMTVAQNLAYALRRRKVPKAEIAERVRAAATMLGLDEFLDRRPSALSGGQRQRVAMGRAIVREPAAFLMDEPLSNLDAKLRVEMRTHLAHLHDRLGITTIYVTHDQVEAMTLGDRVAVMSDGEIRQIAEPGRLYREPESLFVATFIGSPSMNLVGARRTQEDHLSFGGYEFPLPSSKRPPAEDFVLGIRPEHFEDVRYADPTLPTITVIPSVVEETGAEKHVIFPIDAPPVSPEYVSAGVGREGVGLFGDRRSFFTACVDSRSAAREGHGLRLAVDPQTFYLFDAETGAALRRA